MTQDPIEKKIAGLSKERKAWLGVWDSSKKASRKVMPGTCEACVFGRGKHADACEHWIVVACRTSGPSPESVEMLRQAERQYDALFRGTSR